jgi:hypothetical protein
LLFQSRWILSVCQLTWLLRRSPHFIRLKHFRSHQNNLESSKVQKMKLFFFNQEINLDSNLLFLFMYRPAAIFKISWQVKIWRLLELKQLKESGPQPKYQRSNLMVSCTLSSSRPFN